MRSTPGGGGPASRAGSSRSGGCCRTETLPPRRAIGSPPGRKHDAVGGGVATGEPGGVHADSSVAGELDVGRRRSRPHSRSAVSAASSWLGSVTARSTVTPSPSAPPPEVDGADLLPGRHVLLPAEQFGIKPAPAGELGSGLRLRRALPLRVPSKRAQHEPCGRSREHSARAATTSTASARSQASAAVALDPHRQAARREVGAAAARCRQRPRGCRGPNRRAWPSRSRRRS